MYYPLYFSLRELCKTDLRYEQNIPSFRQVNNLVDLCAHVLDPLREKLNCPIMVSSGFRTEELNRIVGGVKNSYHLRGMAADIWCHDHHPSVLYSILKDEFVFSELGLYNSFVHVAYDSEHLDMQTFVHLDK